MMAPKSPQDPREKTQKKLALDPKSMNLDILFENANSVKRIALSSILGFELSMLLGGSFGLSSGVPEAQKTSQKQGDSLFGI